LENSQPSLLQGLEISQPSLLHPGLAFLHVQLLAEKCLREAKKLHGCLQKWCNMEKSTIDQKEIKNLHWIILEVRNCLHCGGMFVRVI
jgi:hypothetical protein